MKVRIAADLCEGHAQCVSAAPEIFAIDDDDDIARVLLPDPPVEKRGDVETARSLCPVRAITVEG